MLISIPGGGTSAFFDKEDVPGSGSFFVQLEKEVAVVGWSIADGNSKALDIWYYWSMSNPEACGFCDGQELEWRTIRHGKLFRSIVSQPGFRADHSLVIPDRHIETVDELTEMEGFGILSELGRLAARMNAGYGTEITQKHQPRVENGIRMAHLHFHVFPLREVEAGIFPTPEPNTAEAFTYAPEDDVIETALRLS